MPTIERLPRELILSTIETHFVHSTCKHDRKNIFTLALVSRHTSFLVDYILYHSIIITSPRALRLLARMANTPHGAQRLARNVENIFVGPIRSYPLRDEHVGSILRAVRLVKKLAMHESMLPALTNTTRPISMQPTHVELSSFSQLPTAALLEGCTHLAFSSPGEKWVEPLPFLLSLPLPAAPGRLTHLSLARREHSNTENDFLFTNCIMSLLSPHHPPPQFANLERVVIRIFPVFGAEESDPDAEIWRMLRMAVGFDKRVVLKSGNWDAWRDEWVDDITGVRCSWI